MNLSLGDTISTSNVPERRSFLASAAAIIAGGVALLFPFAAGWGVLFDPLRRRRANSSGDHSDSTGFLHICSLDSLPADGLPHQFVVTADVTDAWTRTIGQRIGSVFLSRHDAEGAPNVSAFTATCPHLGCAVEFSATGDRFECPCHESGFGKDGEKLFGPSLRGLDPLDVKLVEKDRMKEVWVAFRRFRAGVRERIPVG